MLSEPVPFRNCNARCPEILIVLPLTRPVSWRASPDTSLFGLQSGAIAADSELLPVPVNLSHLPWTSGTSEAGMPACSQNLSFGWIHTVFVFAMATIANPPLRPSPNHPVQPLCVTDMLIEKIWPEALPDPW